MKIFRKQTTTAETVIMDGAVVCGDVTLGKGCSVWFNAVLRGDSSPITVGEKTNLQECVIVHVDEGAPVHVGNGVTVGHGAILHGCTVGDNTLIGMGAIVLNGARIGRDCIIGAGSLVTSGTVIPSGWMAYGNPAKVVRPLRPEEIEANRESAEEYFTRKEMYR